jgi:hypothetical protein
LWGRTARQKGRGMAPGAGRAPAATRKQSLQ